MNRILIECEDTDFVMDLIKFVKNSGKNLKIFEISGGNEKKVKNKILLNDKELKNKIINELIYLGYDLSYKGTQYLIESIAYIMYEPDMYLKNLEKNVYTKISNVYNTSIHNVKCDINRANTIMYTTCEIEKLKNYFGFTIDTKPKIKNVITTIIHKIS